MAADEAPCLVHQGEVQTAVMRAMCDTLPNGGWSSCIVEYRKASRVAESQVKLTDPDGVTVVVNSQPEMISAFKRLRELIGRHGHGARPFATVTATPDGKCSFDYNYGAPR